MKNVWDWLWGSGKKMESQDTEGTEKTQRTRRRHRGHGERQGNGIANRKWVSIGKVDKNY